jgi:hypothetical protein
MAINLKMPGGTKILKRLVEWADVMITNFPHGTREKLRLGYEEVSGWNPRLIYADITGFGDAGPDATLPGFDVTAYWSRSGLLASTRDAGAPPTVPVYGSGDYMTAIGIYAAIVTALYHRERTGAGANVGTSLRLLDEHGASSGERRLDRTRGPRWKQSGDDRFQRRHVHAEAAAFRGRGPKAVLGRPRRDAGHALRARRLERRDTRADRADR